nr:uncharacterized protein LOC118039011 [Populus alba]
MKGKKKRRHECVLKLTLAHHKKGFCVVLKIQLCFSSLSLPPFFSHPKHKDSISNFPSKNFSASFNSALVRMDSSKHILGSEGCSSSESGWTMYLASPMQEDDEECSYDANDYNARNVSKNYRSAADGDSDDSMASDASSGPHHQNTHENGHGAVHFKFSKGGLFNLLSSAKPEKKDKKSDEDSAKKSRKLDAPRKHK